mmetsp:Transcript_7472/g.33234  ORF Transcript_7472/g.33234 Transcript_7472/m.33234 type:complete len:235 (-) Transcript_7472:1182-1886(-)
MSPMTDLSSSRVTTPSPSRSNMRNMRSASEPVASARPACVKLPNLSSAAAFAAASALAADAMASSALTAITFTSPSIPPIVFSDCLAILFASFAASSADLAVDAIPTRFSTRRFKWSNSVRSLDSIASLASSVSCELVGLMGDGGAGAPTTGARDLTAARMLRTSSMHTSLSSLCAPLACRATSTASSAARLRDSMSAASSRRTASATAVGSRPAAGADGGIGAGGGGGGGGGA